MSGDLFASVAGECPACHRNTLFLGSGGHVTCSLLGCPDPTAADIATLRQGLIVERDRLLRVLEGVVEAERRDRAEGAYFIQGDSFLGIHLALVVDPLIAEARRGA